MKARKLFWYALVLLIASQMFTVFARSADNFGKGLLSAITSAFLVLPLGIFYPIHLLMNYSTPNHLSGETYADILSIVFAFLSAFSLIYGSRIYAHGKGYHNLVGYLGLLGFFGIIILLLLQDKTKTLAIKPKLY
ncbi:MAG: hypothetical protein HY231_16800 [Acidobacteria bacterium]|nr:hypothetical protein [Acidobacteriota bacterium]